MQLPKLSESHDDELAGWLDWLVGSFAPPATWTEYGRLPRDGSSVMA